MKNVEYISPNCCDKSKKTKVVRLGLYPEDTEYGEWKKIKPKWYVCGNEFDKYHDKHYVMKIEIEKCPFCGEILPDVEINKKYKKIAEGDEEYCDTCGERHMCCDCYPPEYRWKPI
jgi:hypothetical protein